VGQGKRKNIAGWGPARRRHTQKRLGRQMLVARGQAAIRVWAWRNFPRGSFPQAGGLCRARRGGGFLNFTETGGRAAFRFVRQSVTFKTRIIWAFPATVFVGPSGAGPSGAHDSSRQKPGAVLFPLAGPSQVAPAAGKWGWTTKAWPAGIPGNRWPVVGIPKLSGNPEKKTYPNQKVAPCQDRRLFFVRRSLGWGEKKGGKGNGGGGPAEKLVGPLWSIVVRKPM